MNNNISRFQPKVQEKLFKKACAGSLRLKLLTFSLKSDKIGQKRVKNQEKNMALTKESAASIVSKYGKNEKDTGATEVQIALLTERINQLTEHCKQFKKDKSGQRGLLILVGKRRRMLKYIQNTNLEGYRKLIKELGLRK
jgi:small subunit ribosomal protein S15